MKKQSVVVAALAGLILAATPMRAHHSFAAEFDVNKPLKLRGVVTEWELTNPHSWIHLDVKGADGKTVSWMIEGGSPNSLFRLGFNKESLPEPRLWWKAIKPRTEQIEPPAPSSRSMMAGSCFSGSVPGANPDSTDPQAKK